MFHPLYFVTKYLYIKINILNNNNILEKHEGVKMNKKIIIIEIILIISLCSSAVANAMSVVSSSNQDINKDLNFNDKLSVESNNNEKISESWAVISGCNPYDDDFAGKQNVKLANHLHRILLKDGWQKDNIKLLTGKVTKDELFDGLSWIEARSDYNDTVFIWLYSHGGRNIFALYDENLHYRELDEKLDKIKCAGMSIYIGACHSGSAIKWLKNENNRVVITSCRASETCDIFSGELYVRGFGGYADYSFTYGDNNGVVTAEESYKYLLERDFSLETPQWIDNYNGQLHLVFQNNLSGGKKDQIPCCTVDGGDSDTYLLFGLNYGWKKVHVAQSFTPSVNVLTKIDLSIYGDEDSASLKVSIRKDLTSEDLASVIIPPDNVPGYHDLWWLEVDFEPDIEVEPGEKYYIICSSVPEENEEEHVYYQWESISDISYDGGECYISEDNGETWQIYREIPDLFFVTYGYNKGGNFPPYIPRRPAGEVNGKKDTEYLYYVLTQDYDKDQIYYLFDWGDGSDSGWLGPYDSGYALGASHKWFSNGKYNVKVKAKDIYGTETDWSDSLMVSISKGKSSKTIQYNFLQKHLDHFPLFEQILQRLSIFIQR